MASKIINRLDIKKGEIFQGFQNEISNKIVWEREKK